MEAPLDLAQELLLLVRQVGLHLHEDLGVAIPPQGQAVETPPKPSMPSDRPPSFNKAQEKPAARLPVELTPPPPGPTSSSKPVEQRPKPAAKPALAKATRAPKPIPSASPPTAGSFTLEPPPVTAETSVSRFETAIQAAFPKQPLIKPPPKKALEQTLKGTSVYILHHAPLPPRDQLLLKNLALALTNHGLSTTLRPTDAFEQPRDWEAFLSQPHMKFLIIADEAMGDLPTTLWDGAHGESDTLKLGKVPLVRLLPIERYLSKPLLKRDLWKRLLSLCA